MRIVLAPFMIYYCIVAIISLIIGMMVEPVISGFVDGRDVMDSMTEKFTILNSEKKRK